MSVQRNHPACLAGIVVLAALLRSPDAWAHHSDSMFEEKQSVSVKGTVTRFEWQNPHVYIYLEQRTDSGEKVEWEIECSPPSILHTLGWSSTTLHDGDQIEVTGRPSKRPGRKALLTASIQRGQTVLFDRKGEEKQLVAENAKGTAVAHGLEGIWLTQLAPQLDALLDPDKLPLTEAGTTAYKLFHESLHPGANCVPYASPDFMVSPDLKRISKDEGVLYIDGEYDNARRTVHMDMTTHEGALESIQGHSIAHWEGRTLLIDTTHFAYHSMGLSYGVPSGTQKHLVERLTLNEDGRGLVYQFEESDPQFLTKTLTGEAHWIFRPELSYAPPKCDPDNAKRFLQD